MGGHPHMHIVSIKGTNVTLTPSITDTIEKKFLALSKFTVRMEPMAELSVEVGKTTRHHKKGLIWRAEVMLRVPHAVLRAEATEIGLYGAIDLVKDELERQIKQYKEKTLTRVRKGARRAKKLTSLNPDAMYRNDAEEARRLHEDETL
ncbi:ribosome-associated translation inhibitor RaiA [Candidatus Uhrbacteria bacterium]|nr:ribosome-associated translation inhibitor RaiA [Candidatus Uhrbacteria bacterium]